MTNGRRARASTAGYPHPSLKSTSLIIWHQSYKRSALLSGVCCARYVVTHPLLWKTTAIYSMSQVSPWRLTVNCTAARHCRALLLQEAAQRCKLQLCVQGEGDLWCEGHLKTAQYAPTKAFVFSCFSRSSLFCLHSLDFLQLLHQLGFLVRSHASKHRRPQQDLQREETGSSF